MLNPNDSQQGLPGPTQQLTELLERLRSGKQPERFGAARGLGESGDDSVVEALVAALGDRNPLVKQQVLKSLGAIGARSSNPTRRGEIIDLLLDKVRSNTSLGESAARGMAAFGEDALPFLVPLLREQDLKSAHNAAIAISDIGIPALDILAELLNHPNAEIRKVALTGLARRIHNDLRVKTILQSALKNSDEWIRASAAYNLGLHRVTESLPDLLSALQDDAVSVRAKAAIALGRIGSAQAMLALMGALDDLLIRKQVVYALGEIGDSRAIPALRSCETTFDGGLKFLLAMSLTRCGDAAGIDELETICAASDDPEQVIYAIDALGQAGEKHPTLALRIIPVLAARLADNRSPRGDSLNRLRAARIVKRSAAEALEQIGTPEALRALRE